jgi:arginine deiminase
MFCVESEIAPLKSVVISRPKAALERIIPDNTAQFLFDDLLYPDVAQKEHDMFASILKQHGINVYYLEDLLTQTMENVIARKWMVDQLLANYDFGMPFVRDLYDYLMGISADRLCYHLFAGLTIHEACLQHKGIAGVVSKKPSDFLLSPYPNHYFTRDPSCWIGNGVCINRMQYKVRQGEAFNFAAVYKYHPMFTNEKFHIWYDASEEMTFPIEGGDIFSLRQDFVQLQALPLQEQPLLQTNLKAS